ncbi:MAG: hypothetical protein ACETWK_07105 [Candidatus Aminicenantaceae bacterium]
MLFFLISSLFLTPLSSYSLENLEKGKIIDKVICSKEPTQSYALYLPQAYTPEKKWPILYALDPGARGKMPLEHFKKASEKYNYIVVGSNNAQNGPMEPIVRAIIAVWDDTHDRFSIDPQRIYVTGFSGGARVASRFAKIMFTYVTGIIACGAGLSSEITPQEIPPAFYYGIIGNKDFNYLEMKILDGQLSQHKVPHRLLVFDGTHSWPPQDICLRAIECMEIEAMKKDLKPIDKNLIKDIYKRELTDTEALEASGQLFLAVSDYEILEATFRDWMATDEIEKKTAQLKQSESYKRAVKEEKDYQNKELAILKNSRNIISQIENYPFPEMNLNKILDKLKIEDLKREAQNSDNPAPQRNLAFRMLFDLEIYASSKGWSHLEKNDFKRAITFFEVAVQAGAEDSGRQRYSFYGLARAYALNQDKKNAIKNLELAVKNGFNNVSAMEQEDDLQFIRQTPEFKKILNSIKK